MKLESYRIQQALRMDKADLAIELVSRHFNLSKPRCIPRLRQASPGEPLAVVMWNSSYYYSWTSEGGFYTTDPRGTVDRREVKISTIQIHQHSAP
jgi:hypothetical protein